jgi:hypothetical protein
VQDPDLARLLSGRNEPSILEKEALEQRLLAELDGAAGKAPGRPRGVGWLAGLAGAVCAAAAGWFLIVVPDQPEFRARGGGRSHDAPSVRLRCNLQGAAQPCRLGDTLHFELEGLDRPAFLSAYAITPDGSTLWYFPAPAGQSIATGTGAEPRLLDEGIELVEPHTAGQYSVHVVLSPAPLSRQDVQSARASADESRFELPLEVLR